MVEGLRSELARFTHSFKTIYNLNKTCLNQLISINVMAKELGQRFLRNKRTLPTDVFMCSFHIFNININCISYTPFLNYRKMLILNNVSLIDILSIRRIKFSRVLSKQKVENRKLEEVSCVVMSELHYQNVMGENSKARPYY